MDENRILRISLPIAILGMALVIFLLLRFTRPENDPVVDVERSWPVTTVAVEPGDFQPELSLYGTVEAPGRALLRAAVGADVIAVPVAEGDFVDAGEILVELDDREAEFILRQRAAEVVEIEAMMDLERSRYESALQSLEREQRLLDLAQQEMDRARRLLSQDAGAQSFLDDAEQALQQQALAFNTRQLEVIDHPARLAQHQAKLERAQALRDQALLDKQRTEITAPFVGRIAEVRVAPGDRVRSGDPLVDFYPIAGLEARSQIPYAQLPILRRSLDSNDPVIANGMVDERPLRARLDRLSGKTAEGGGVDALFILEQTPRDLVPGRLLSLDLALPPAEGVFRLPMEAIYGADRIYRLQEDRLEALTVQLAGDLDDAEQRYILVHSTELQQGDEVVTTQLPNAVSGLKVTVVDTAAAD